MNASALDLRPLYYFVQVATAGSFSRASASLSVGQPVLSRFIRRLEDDLGVQLLYRHGRGVGLTDAGKRLYDDADQILRNLSQAHLEVAALRGAPLGLVSIALPPLLGTVLSAELVRRVRTNHPLVSIALREGFAAETLDWLSSGELDIGVLFNPPHVATLITQHILDDRIHLVGAPGSLDLVSGAEFPAAGLADLDMILPPEPHRLRGLIQDAARQAGVALKVAVEVSGTNTVLELVRDGVGYTILPSALLVGEKGEGRLASWPITQPAIQTRLFVATSMQRPQTLASKVVLKAITDIFTENLRGLGVGKEPAAPTLDGGPRGSG
ncbi:LysR family transcriptional regulator [Phenylobacterium sp.]|jgi:LysR family nitrogen assimilation transcriptional regulator|uniref:LysR family transcriptional regulator n=1 Tax=Phenylobacterium sp. TaxID=1871053 RepID=UPI002E349004|nr:LysR substrate-binding domain-containing protein [Phenylobacterium sp.]HEX4709005.1 LysR substrate-binding domain-containing protein [Phenylobacterium sp.]